MSKGFFPLVDIIPEKPKLPEKKEWEEHWKGMPEFIQEDLTPFHSLKINFRSKEDIKAFAELIQQNISLKTRSVWFPKAKILHQNLVIEDDES